MSGQYDDTNRGALFKNTDKTKENQPDYRGSGNYRGEEFWISAWLRTARDGTTKYFSFSLQPKEEHQQRKPVEAEPKQESLADGYGDDVPF